MRGLAAEANARAAPAGPGSVSWKVQREIVLLLGWPRALLLQMAHPLVLSGVLDHSSYVADPRTRPQRLTGTVQAMLALTFGTPDEIQRTADAINAIHDRVHGALPNRRGAFAAGDCYTAHDPELLRWVHVTFLESIILAYQAFVGPLACAEQDALCAEAADVEPLLGIPDGFLPRSMLQLRACMDAVYASGAIQVTPEARWMAHQILKPGFPSPPALRPVVSVLEPPLYWLTSLPSVALLPPQIRRDFGLSWSPAQAATFRALTLLSPRLIPLVPPLMRHWPIARA
ncbi:MAG: DUF2236 domain-containing protein [Chloroflexi bacterium]|nr:DUF2236 domain-containing protein [Chloroflexota bacterium]